MRDEYDFTNAERSKFYREDAVLLPPVYLDPEVLVFLTARAQARWRELERPRQRSPEEGHRADRGRRINTRRQPAALVPKLGTRYAISCHEGHCPKFASQILE
jgi:hypothetical protein